MSSPVDSLLNLPASTTILITTTILRPDGQPARKAGKQHTGKGKRGRMKITRKLVKWFWEMFLTTTNDSLTH